jgi:hypothetical protein
MIHHPLLDPKAVCKRTGYKSTPVVGDDVLKELLGDSIDVRQQIKNTNQEHRTSTYKHHRPNATNNRTPNTEQNTELEKQKKKINI